MKFLLFLSLWILTLSAQARLQPGGEFSSLDWSQQAFNHPVGNATHLQKQQFGVGNSFFKQAWVEFPSSTVGRDGLGPTYNAVSCSSCHVSDGRGVAYDSKGRVNLSLLFRLSQVSGQGIGPHPDYGDQFQPFGIADVQGEGSVAVQFETIAGVYPDGTPYELQKPQFQFENFKNRAFDQNTRVSPRVAPHLVGLGLIEAVETQQLLDWEDPHDQDGDGISGRANFVHDIASNTMKMGLFGWKAGQPSLRQQNAAAFNGDMGLTSVLFPQQNCPLVQLDCLQALASDDLEVSDKVLDRVTLYTQIISVPVSRDEEGTAFSQGRQLFDELKCNACHRPDLVTGNFHEVEALRNQIIHPFSDFLLHDMGMGLADHRPDGLANGREWKTPPLWSLGLIEVVNNHSRLLHDGRARNVEEAILWHGGEAQASRDAFMNKIKSEREILMQFIKNI